MTENIQRMIQQISSKTKQLHGFLLEEKTKNERLLSEVSLLKNQLIEKNEELEEQRTLIEAKNSQLAEKTEQNTVLVPEASLSRGREIDELVKEIEYCISQLRK